MGAASCRGTTAGQVQKDGGCAGRTSQLSCCQHTVAQLMALQAGARQHPGAPAPHCREMAGLFLPTPGAPSTPLHPPSRAPCAAAWGQAGLSGLVHPQHPIGWTAGSLVLALKQQTVLAFPPLALLPSLLADVRALTGGLCSFIPLICDSLSVREHGEALLML